MVAVKHLMCQGCRAKLDPESELNEFGYCDTCWASATNVSEWYASDLVEARYDSKYTNLSGCPPCVNPTGESAEGEDDGYGGIMITTYVEEVVTKALVEWLRHFDRDAYHVVEDVPVSEYGKTRVRMKWSCYHNSSPGDGECIMQESKDLYSSFEDRRDAGVFRMGLKYVHLRCGVKRGIAKTIVGLVVWSPAILVGFRYNAYWLWRLRFQNLEHMKRVIVNQGVGEEWHKYREWVTEYQEKFKAVCCDRDMDAMRKQREIRVCEEGIARYTKSIQEDREKAVRNAYEYIARSRVAWREFFSRVMLRDSARHVRELVLAWCRKFEIKNRKPLKWLHDWFYGIHEWEYDEEETYQCEMQTVIDRGSMWGLNQDMLEEHMLEHKTEYPCSCEACMFELDRDAWVESMIGASDFNNWDWHILDTEIV